MIMSTIIKFVLGKMPWLSAVPWKLVGIVAMATALVGLGWTVRGWKEDAANQAETEKTLTTERQATTNKINEHNAVQVADEKDTQTSAQKRDDIQQNEAALHQAVAGRPLLDQPEVPSDETIPPTPIAVRSTTYRVCVNAAITGAAADLATCEAAGGHAAL